MQGLQQSARLTHLFSVSTGAKNLSFTRSGNPHRRQKLHILVTSAGKAKGQAHFQSYVQAAPPQQNFLAASPWYIKAPLALIAISLVARLLKRMTRGEKGCAALICDLHVLTYGGATCASRLCPANLSRSLDSLEGRGLINEERNVSNTDPFYNSEGTAMADSLDMSCGLP